MDPIFDFATNVMQVCAYVLPTELHFNHPHKKREEEASFGERIHMSDQEISKKGENHE